MYFVQLRIAPKTPKPQRHQKIVVILAIIVNIT